MTNTFLTIGLTVGIGLLLADLFIEAQLSSPLNKMLDVAQQVASGEPGEMLILNRAHLTRHQSIRTQPAVTCR